MAASGSPHSKSVSSYRMNRGSGWALESRPNRCLQPAKPPNRHFRDYLLTGHAADMPKSTVLTHLRHQPSFAWRPFSAKMWVGSKAANATGLSISKSMLPRADQDDRM